MIHYFYLLIHTCLKTHLKLAASKKMIYLYKLLPAKKEQDDSKRNDFKSTQF